MKQCLACNGLFSSLKNTCHSCGTAYLMRDGIPIYAPFMADQPLGFKESYFATLADLEDKNFWFRARNRLIIWALGHYAAKFNSFLEIGCGTGYVLSGIAKAYPHATLQGSELFTQGLSFAAQRLPHVNLMQMDARQIPFVDEFDCIGAFDVLEHIEEDTQVLAQIHHALKPKGIVILTVPQHQWLWSRADEYACHVRRYSAHELQTKLKETGFEVLRSTSFVTSLLPAMFASRVAQKFSKKEYKLESELSLSPWLNSLFEKMLHAEIQFIRKGINFPMGGTRLVVARKL